MTDLESEKLLLDREWASCEKRRQRRRDGWREIGLSGVEMYRLTDNGLAVDFTAKSTRYSRMMR